jgi:hypothetical protein
MHPLYLPLLARGVNDYAGVGIELRESYGNYAVLNLSNMLSLYSDTD